MDRELNYIESEFYLKGIILHGIMALDFGLLRIQVQNN
jgi:hypothetical protein